MREQAAQCQADFDAVDAALGASSGASSENMDGKRDHDTLMAGERRHRSMKVVRFEAHDVFGIGTLGMGRPVAVAGLRAPTRIFAIGRTDVPRAIAAPGLARKRHLADLGKQIAMIDDPVADDVDDLSFVLYPAPHPDHRGGHNGASLLLGAIELKIALKTRRPVVYCGSAASKYKNRQSLQKIRVSVGDVDR